MARPVSPADIRVLMDTTLSDADLSVFAEDAHVVVSETIPANALSEARLTLLEKYLAAHFAAMRDKQKTSEHIGPASTSYEGQTGLYLTFTHFGQQVMVLDPTGSFAALDQGADSGTVAELHVYGVAS